MIIGVPKEIKPQENRIGAVPAMVLELVEAGHTVLIEQGGGLGAGVTDEEILQCFYSYMEPQLSSYRKITILIGGFKRKWGGSRRNPTGSKWRAKMYPLHKP